MQLTILVIIPFMIMAAIPFATITINKSYPNERAYKYIPSVVSLVLLLNLGFLLIFNGKYMDFLSQLLCSLSIVFFIICLIISFITAVIIGLRKPNKEVQNEEQSI